MRKSFFVGLVFTLISTQAFAAGKTIFQCQGTLNSDRTKLVTVDVIKEDDGHVIAQTAVAGRDVLKSPMTNDKTSAGTRTLSRVSDKGMNLFTLEIEDADQGLNLATLKLLTSESAKPTGSDDLGCTNLQ